MLLGCSLSLIATLLSGDSLFGICPLTTQFLSNREGEKQIGRCASLENSFSIVHLFTFKKLIQKESRKFYKCLKPLVLEKVNENIILKNVFFTSISQFYSSCSTDHQIKWMKFYIWIQQIPSESQPAYFYKRVTKSLAACSPWSLANR